MPRGLNNGKTQYLFSYDRNKVKTANERLRKLEKVNKLASQSPAYMEIKKYAKDEPNSLSHKFYEVRPDGSIRFKNKTEFDKLTKYEQSKYMETLNQFLNNATTTKLGILKAQRDSYNKFMENHPNLNWSQEEWAEFMKRLGQYEIDKDDTERYNRLTQFFESPTSLQASSFYDNKHIIDDEKIKAVLHYIDTGKKYADIAPTRPDSHFTNTSGERRYNY